MCVSSAYTLSHGVIFHKLLQLFPPTGNRGPCFTVRSVRDSIIYSDYKDTVLCQSLLAAALILFVSLIKWGFDIAICVSVGQTDH